MTLPTIDGKGVTVSGSNNRWQTLVVYRGLHCPICETCTAKIEALKEKFDELETDIVFISGDTAEKVKNFANEIGLNLPVAYDLSIKQMRQHGLYISERRPNANKIPIGSDKTIPTPAMTSVRNKPPQSLVSTFSRPNPPEKRKTQIIGNIISKNIPTPPLYFKFGISR